MKRAWIVLAVLLPVSVAHAVPGPDSVAVLANADVPGSVALARAYAAARDVPARQVCALSLPTTDDITLDEFTTRVLAPLRTCLGTIEPRIEAVVVMRGVPLRVTIPADGGHHVSLAAALGTWRSTLVGSSTPLLGTSPGTTVSCGGTSTCYAARVPNGYSPLGIEAFSAGFAATSGGVDQRPVLVTMLHGRSDADAMRLIDAATTAEASAPHGEMMLMRGADGARGALDSFDDAIAMELTQRGVTASVVDFSADMAGHTLAGFATGGASLGTTIEGNTYVSGALVDNLTSFGAVPENFAATGESQVSIARWVAAGVGGVHGTVDEPLNNCFPSREFLVRYADGATLAEAFHGSLPYAYWLNLVLGDPMLAPYARRPTVAIAGAAEGTTLDGARTLVVTATPPSGRAIAHLSLFVDGEEVQSLDAAATLSHCLSITRGAIEVLAVATTAPAAETDRAPWPAKGWTMLHLQGATSDATCDAPDAGQDAAMASDAATSDASTSAAPRAGCACRAAGRGPSPTPAWLALAFVALNARRRSRR